eukprot:TRINITY_DN1926_c0_g2_i1.p1 TRINITY_DN1926_c0_g2~~TRINITY_DN1926_c0_g2_i1.p1  ORF type:complete len:585 (-),score=89.95 TRINITY_DN1926_c0_g2_i1:41-1795(-)
MRLLLLQKENSSLFAQLGAPKAYETDEKMKAILQRTRTHLEQVRLREEQARAKEEQSHQQRAREEPSRPVIEEPRERKDQWDYQRNREPPRVAKEEQYQRTREEPRSAKEEPSRESYQRPREEPSRSATDDHYQRKQEESSNPIREEQSYLRKREEPSQSRTEQSAREEKHSQISRDLPSHSGRVEQSYSRTREEPSHTVKEEQSYTRREEPSHSRIREEPSLSRVREESSYPKAREEPSSIQNPEAQSLNFTLSGSQSSNSNLNLNERALHVKKEPEESMPVSLLRTKSEFNSDLSNTPAKVEGEYKDKLVEQSNRVSSFLTNLAKNMKAEASLEDEYKPLPAVRVGGTEDKAFLIKICREEAGFEPVRVISTSPSNFYLFAPEGFHISASHFLRHNLSVLVASNVYYCDICRCPITGKENLQHHVKAAKHTLNANKGKTEEPSPPDSSFRVKVSAERTSRTIEYNESPRTRYDREDRDRARDSDRDRERDRERDRDRDRDRERDRDRDIDRDRNRDRRWVREIKVPANPYYGKRTLVCEFYLKGLCKFGANCNYAHTRSRSSYSSAHSYIRSRSPSPNEGRI